VTHARRAGALLALVAGAVTACSSSTHGVAAQLTTAVAPPTSAAVPTTPPPTSAAPPVTQPPTSGSSSPTVRSEPTPPASTPPRSTCTDVSVRVLPGGASPGEEIAALQFTNTGHTSCTLVGYPTVTLLLHGRQIGLQSQPSTPGADSARELAPGAVAESLLHDYTQTCQAPLSDTVRVVVPGSSQTYLRPQFQLRACIVRVDRLGAPE
jgi:hypothetical protein